MNNVVTRFAPSPTGFMHIGGVRTALFAYLWARKNRGTFILRIEDTDREREVAGSVEHIMESLRWLDLEWDFGPDKPGPFGSCIQSDRLDTYRVAANVLINKGLAYPDPYAAEEIEAFRKETLAEKRLFLFRDHRPSRPGSWDGTRPLRFLVPEIKRYEWEDDVRGTLSAGEESLDDFILMKSDGYPTYNFAHIVDDNAMGITHVFRADEFISSTPRFLSLYDALGYKRPHFVTLPPILREDRTKKLGKRDGAKDLLQYREEGYLPEAMTNFLALIGWNPGTDQELFSKHELTRTFDVAQIQKHGAVFNEEKLRWFNKQYLLRLSDASFAAHAAEILDPILHERGVQADERVVERITGVIRERISVWDDLKSLARAGEFDFFFAPPTLDTSSIAHAQSSPQEAQRHLSWLTDAFSELSEDEFYDAGTLKNTVWEHATGEGRAAVLWPLRYALTGRERSPDPFSVAAAIGKDASIRRLHIAQEALKTL